MRYGSNHSVRVLSFAVCLALKSGCRVRRTRNSNNNNSNASVIKRTFAIIAQISVRYSHNSSLSSLRFSVLNFRRETEPLRKLSEFVSVVICSSCFRIHLSVLFYTVHSKNVSQKKAMSNCEFPILREKKSLKRSTANITCYITSNTQRVAPVCVGFRSNISSWAIAFFRHIKHKNIKIIHLW